eukprot:14539888-Alexandrium_andersonii.AAC.1
MAPVVDTGLLNFGARPKICKNNNDPISIIDRGAKSYERQHGASINALGTATSVVSTALTGNEESNNMAANM